MNNSLRFCPLLTLSEIKVTISVQKKQNKKATAEHNQGFQHDLCVSGGLEWLRDAASMWLKLIFSERAGAVDSRYSQVMNEQCSVMFCSA